MASNVESSLFAEHLKSVINPCWNFAGRCNTHTEEVMNAVLGLGGEAGEIVDQCKKLFFHTDKGFDFHREKLVSELGDSFFYHIKFMDLMGITLEEVLAANKVKLQSRHPELGKVQERFGKDAIK